MHAVRIVESLMAGCFRNAAINGGWCFARTEMNDQSARMDLWMLMILIESNEHIQTETCDAGRNRTGHYTVVG